MKVLLAGNKQIAISCLKILQTMDVDILGLIACHNDTSDSWYPSATEYAIKHGITVFRPRSINDREFVDVLRSLRADIIVSAQYDKILSTHVIGLPKLGVINLHFAPLPKYQGMMPLVWAIVDGGPAGVTLHYIDKGIDTGDVIAQTLLPIQSDDTARILYDKASSAGAELFKEYFPMVLAGTAPRIRQDESQATYHSVGYPNDRWLDLSWDEERKDRFVRALTFPPYPSARILVNGKEMEVIYRYDLSQ